MPAGASAALPLRRPHVVPGPADRVDECPVHRDPGRCGIRGDELLDWIGTAFPDRQPVLTHR